jgi:hypothetical protein
LARDDGLAVSIDLSLALLPFLKLPLNWMPPSGLPESCPSDLQVWLGRCNGLDLDDGTWLLGWGLHLSEMNRIERVFELFPEFLRMGWWPVATDGFGNYWVLTGDGVGFVDCAEDIGRIAYVAASSLDRFLVPFRLPSLDRSGWPFDQATVRSWDPLVLGVNFTKPWEN